MDSRVELGVIAVFAGLLVGAVLFVPFVALSYRRRGRLSLGRLALFVAALVYFWALWAYTLLPLPDPQTLVCAGTNTDPLAFVDDLWGAWSNTGSPTAFLRDTAVLQLALNVLLFVPLGFFVRALGGRGILVAIAAGFATSLFVELAQLTGMWGAYDCAYRVFDVDDLLTNTVGAALGSLLALVVPRGLSDPSADVDPGAPRPVTVPRRLLAMLCDWLGYTLTTFAVAVAVRAYLIYLADDRATAVEGPVSTIIGGSVTLAVWLLVILTTGRSPGDHVVRLRYVGGSMPVAVSRLLRFLAGIGGYGLLDLLPEEWSILVTICAGVAVVTALFTRNGRGLPGVLNRQELVDSRALPQPAVEVDSTTRT
ncbi:VanZ family protein [Rhodococcus rhodochrous]|uniref:VanZ family protein n=1 Tax=Rhodococcus rhodochrous TaxID=1829 RepID=UPI002B269CE5|nr:VanZ family protein [Rhodococcus rhodochrous]